MEKVEFLCSDGSTLLDLTNNVYNVLAGKKYLTSPAYEITDSEVPFQDGAIFEYIRAKATQFDLPLLIRGLDKADLQTRHRYLIKMLNPLLGEGQIRYTGFDGTQRYINCRCLDGLRGNDKPSMFGKNFMAMTLTFFAADPFWYEMTEQEHTFSQAVAAGTFFPFFPLTLVSSAVYSSETLSNDGDAVIYPYWTITGPGDEIVLRNTTTGKKLDIDYELEADEILYVDTAIGVKTVKDVDGNNLREHVSRDSSLWGLEVGSNILQIEMNLTTANSEVKLSYRRKYLGPYGN